MNLKDELAEINRLRAEADRRTAALIMELAKTPEVGRITIREAARRCNCSTKTINRRVQAGIYKQEGRFILLESMAK